MQGIEAVISYLNRYAKDRVNFSEYKQGDIWKHRLCGGFVVKKKNSLIIANEFLFDVEKNKLVSFIHEKPLKLTAEGYD